ncbi:hypothetical protein AB0395_05730 [Streptosporangium sp. NPDC051023]|uniref:hypothetical protein n=1 Tax=Streptosporangium sp. NPDC051023 TaxID=3155410 RepID=UPI00344B9A31
MNAYLDFDALWRVLVAALLGGAGLVAIFSVGLVGLASTQSSDDGAGRPLGWVVAVVSFLVVAAGVVLGISVMLNK